MLWFVFILSAYNSKLFAQSPEQNTSYFGGFVLRSNGLGLAYSSYAFLRPNLNRMIEFDLVTHRHQKEVKILNTIARDPSAYVFGKLNKVAQFRLNAGINKPISEMDENGHIGISVSITAGAAAIFLKPVYLDIYHPSSNGEGIVVPERYNPNEHVNQQDIIGYANSRYGWNQLSVRPALNIKTSIDLKWGSYSNAIKLFRIGSVVEYFPTGLPIMAMTQNPNFVFSLFASISLGKEIEL